MWEKTYVYNYLLNNSTHMNVEISVVCIYIMEESQRKSGEDYRVDILVSLSKKTKQNKNNYSRDAFAA